MPSPKLSKEQHEKQLAGLAADLEKRKLAQTAGKQITAKGFLKREQKAALEIISKTNKGIPDPMPEGYKHPSKTELDNAWKIVNAVRDYDKHDVALKIAKLAAQKAEHEAKTAGYGESAPEALKKKAEENNGRPRLALTMKQVIEDEDYEELEDE
jgi:hypothetical protein